MAAIQFPNNPNTGDLFTASNGIRYTYDGEKWKTLGSSTAGSEGQFLETPNILLLDKIIPANTNTGAVGPMAIDAGVTLTVPVSSTFRTLSGKSGSGANVATDGSPKMPISGGTFTGPVIFTDNITGASANFSGNVGIGTDSPEFLLDIWGEGPDTAQVTLRQWNNNSTNANDGPDMRFIASGGTITTPAEVDNNDVIGKVNGFAYDGTNSVQYGGFGWRYYRDATDPLDIKKGSTFAIETKSINESSHSAKLNISETGNVGIGTDDPQGKLEITDSSAVIADTIYLNNYISGALGNRIAANKALILGADRQNNAPTAESYVAFEVDADEKMRIDKDGNVGIGTSSPSQKLHVNGNILGNNYYLGTDAGTYGIASDTSIEMYGAASSQVMLFKVNGDSERMRIDSSGNVGIGTSSPTNLLHIYDDAGANDKASLKIEAYLPKIRFQDRSTSSASAEISGDNALKFNISTPVDDNTSLTERMRITNAGLVGIGTSTPTRSLHVVNNTICVARFESTGTSGGTIDLKDANTTADFKVSIGAKTDDFVVNTDATESLRVNSSGNVGIGTSSPSVKLDVNGTISGTLQNTDVLTATASSSAGAVGTYAFLKGTSSQNAGDTESGSNLSYSNANGTSSGTPSGSWRLMGYTQTSSTARKTSLWLRYV